MKDISDLPIDLQRKLIDYCIQENATIIFFDGEEYSLPNIIQITYFCEVCSGSFPIKIFKEDVILNKFMSSLPCPNCDVPKNRVMIYIYHKTSVTQQILVRSQQKKLDKTIIDYINEGVNENE